MLRINLPNEEPIGDIHSAPFGVFLPTKHDWKMLRKDFVVLIHLVFWFSMCQNSSNIY